MGNKYWAATGCLGCMTLVLLVAVIAVPLVIVPMQIRTALASSERVLAPAAPLGGEALPPVQIEPQAGERALPALYEQVNQGVVSIQVYQHQGLATHEGAGSGFVLDDQGHIVTNNHVIERADILTVVFSNGIEVAAQVVGTDPDSDLAVVKVDSLPEGAHPLPLGDSDRVRVGETVIAIGNPFGLGGSMTVGIVSAVGRTIASGATPFSIPHAIQTDAAINPGNSGGPLLNLQGEVVGVNAQIATSGARANAGVGFAIPAGIVRRVAPVLIEHGAFQWAWLGVTGGAVNMAIAQANDLPDQQGAYIHTVQPDGPAEAAGLRGSTGTVTVDGVLVPVGGDVIVAVDGRPVADFDALLLEVASRDPGESVTLTILRDGRERAVSVALEPRPGESGR